MNIILILKALAVIGIVGIIVGLFLGIASVIFKVEKDERVDAVLKALPGNNCGGCGYPGCEGLANAIVKNEAKVNQCPVGGDKVGNEIAKIMGKEADEGVKKVAFVACHAHCDDISVDYEYYGVNDCRMLSFVPNQGPKSCKNGCLGFGSCVKVCPFDAIHIEDGVAVVDRIKCKACGKCVAICPKHLISLVPYNAKFAVACSNTQKGAISAKQCNVSCVGCGMCQKNCPNEACAVNDFVAKIDYEKCKNCGVCAEKCPRKCIIKMYE